MSGVLFTFLSPCISQEKYDTLPEGYKRNVLKWNVTPFFLWGSQNINLSYERVLKPYRTFSINAGYFVLPSLGSFDSLNFTNERNKSGFSISGDYRFYFKGRNTRNAPDGLYWAVYGSYHHYQFQNDFEVNNSPTIQGKLDLDGSVNVFSAGVELGYQFLIKDRFTIDLIFMGPSLSVYTGQLKLDGDLTVDEKDEYLKAIRDILTGKFPFLDDLVEYGGFSEKGTSTSFGYGFRYMIQLGYRF
ncbi:MAG: autotransporter outer membrane beta-barrel domain-containing protein [Bacteroidales bacterium]|nr:autotransporter outer membrane beta-barrel domain-containing protein [Bacteroidales bacterium]